MKKKIFLCLLFVMARFLAGAQDNLSFAPQQPKPGDVVHISYTPPSTVFDATDVIACTASKWGVYNEAFPLTEGERNYKPVEVVLKKTGNHYEGEVQTDTCTRLLTFAFTSGQLKWKTQNRLPVLVTGKVDNNQNTGYCIPFYTAQGNICQYSHFFMGKYMEDPRSNGLGFKNTEKGLEHFLKENELFAGAKYYTSFSIAQIYPREKKEQFKTEVVAPLMEKLFAGGPSQKKTCV